MWAKGESLALHTLADSCVHVYPLRMAIGSLNLTWRLPLKTSRAHDSEKQKKFDPRNNLGAFGDHLDNSLYSPSHYCAGNKLLHIRFTDRQL